MYFQLVVMPSIVTDFIAHTKLLFIHNTEKKPSNHKILSNFSPDGTEVRNITSIARFFLKFVYFNVFSIIGTDFMTYNQLILIHNVEKEPIALVLFQLWVFKIMSTIVSFIDKLSTHNNQKSKSQFLRYT